MEPKKQVEQYESDWVEFKSKIESLAKGRCIITNKNWAKLQEIHLSMYLSQIDNPFSFLFQIKFFYPNKYRQVCGMPKLYHDYKQKRDLFFQN